MDGKVYEDIIHDLFLGRGVLVRRHPNIQGLTPDFLVSDLAGQCLVECTTLTFGRNCEKHDHLWGTNDPTQLNARLHCSLEGKLQKYTAEVCGGIPLVVAIFNEDCARFDSSILEAALGAWRFQSGKWVNLWAGTDDADGLFGKYPHCSGIIHSTPSDHLFVPNPNAINPVSTEFFTFASISEPLIHPDGVNASEPKSPPKNAPLQRIRNRNSTIDGQPFRQTDSVIDILGVSEDGNPEISITLKVD